MAENNVENKGTTIGTMAENNVENKNAYAYVWLLMKGDSYLPGILASVYSVRVTNPKADLIVMVTPDVSNHAKEQIMALSAMVQNVDYIDFKNKFRLSEQSRPKYGSWIDVSHTKWNCLKLPYKKILMLDADVLILTNIDSVFELSAPAGHFFLTNNRSYRCEDRNIFNASDFDWYGNLKEGTIVQPVTIRKILNTKQAQLPIASSMLLEPSIEEFNLFIDAMKKLPDNCFTNETGADEQSMAYFQSIVLGRSWRHLGINWNTFSSSRYAMQCKVMHFMFAEKPWTVNKDLYSDVYYWHSVYEKAQLCITDKEKNQPCIADNNSLSISDNNSLSISDKESC